MKISIATAAGVISVLLIGGCAEPADQRIAFNDPDQHTTAATGFGLGPEYFKTNGGAFGPDQLGH